MFSEIIVPVAGWRTGSRAMELGDLLAQRFDVPLSIVSVIEPSNQEMADERMLLLRAMASELNAPSTLSILEGSNAAEEVARFLGTRSNPLVIMPTASGGATLDAVLGSTAESLVHRITNPVMLLGPRSDISAPLLRPALFCVDGSDHAESALPLATMWHHTAGTPMWVVCRQAEPDEPSDLVETSYVHRVATEIGPDVEWEVLHAHNPARAISAYAESLDAGLIIMATHGRTGLARVAFGSTALQVVHRAPCPVLVQRPLSLVAQQQSEKESESRSTTV